MSNVINLNKMRKKKAREAAAQQAAENRVRHGRTLAQKQLDAAQAAEAARKLDGLRRSPADDTPPSD